MISEIVPIRDQFFWSLDHLTKLMEAYFELGGLLSLFSSTSKRHKEYFKN